MTVKFYLIDVLYFDSISSDFISRLLLFFPLFPLVYGTTVIRLTLLIKRTNNKDKKHNSNRRVTLEEWYAFQKHKQIQTKHSVWLDI